MPIRFEAKVNVARPPADCFAFLDDFANTPRWNDRCVELKQTSKAPHAVGSALHYVYKEPGRQGEMTGTITEYEPGRCLTMKFTDAILDVEVGFRFEPAGAGTAIAHTIEITPKSFLMKLMTLVIGGATRKQVEKEAAALQRLLAP
jgi:uncharacterized protein YndB with AHSA1/START domain